MGLPEQTFEQPEVGGTSADSSYWVSRVIYYPPLIQAQQKSISDGVQHTAQQHGEIERSVQLSCGEHTDYGLLTLVNQEDHVSALQVIQPCMHDKSDLVGFVCGTTASCTQSSPQLM